MIRPAPGVSAGPDAAPAAPLSRRQVLLRVGGGLLALAVLGGAATACGDGKPPEPDPLEEQLAAARGDSALAAAAADGAAPPLRAALTEVSAERARHATALVEELARAAGKPTPSETDTATTAASAAPSPSASPARPPGLSEVVAALRRSADSAAALVPGLSGSRAGLMGSIAAACTAAYTVGLPSGRKPQ